MASKRLKRFLLSLLLLPVLLLGLGLLAFSPFFLRAVVLPRIETATGVRLEAKTLRVSPFTGLVLERGTLADSNRIDAAFERLVVSTSLKDLLADPVRIRRARLENASITLNSEAFAETSDDPSGDTGPATPPALRLEDLELRQVEVRLASPDRVVEVVIDRLSIPLFQPGAPTQFELEAAVAATGHESDRPLRGSLTADGSFTLDDQYRPAGLDLSLVTNLQPPDPAYAPLRLETSVRALLDDTLLRLYGLNVLLRQGGRDLLTLALAEETRVDLADPLSTLADTRLTLDIPGVRIADLGIPAGLLPIEDGRIEAESHWTVTGAGRRFSAETFLQAEELDGGGALPWLRQGGVRLTLPLHGTPDRVNLAKNTSLRLENQGTAVVSAGLNGHVDFTGGDSRMKLTLQAADLGALAALSPELDSIKGSLSGEATLEGRGPTHFNWTANLTLAHPGWPLPLPPPHPITLLSDGARRGEALSGAPLLELAWPAGPHTNDLGLTVDLSDATPPDLAGGVRIYSDRLDIGPWLDRWSPSPEAATPSGPSDASPPAPLPLEHLDVQIGLGRVLASGLDLKLSGAARLQPTRAEINTLFGTLNGAEYQARGWRDWGAAPGFELDANLEPLEIQPFLDRLQPEKAGAVRGRVRGAVDLRGEGLDWARLHQSLEGTADLTFSDGRLRLVDTNLDRNAGLVEAREVMVDVITRIARLLRLPPEELLEPPITDMALNLDTGDGRMTLRSLRVENPEFRLETRGLVTLAPEAGASRLERLPVTVGFSTNVAERLKINRADRLREGKIVLPPLVEVEGELEDPVIDIDKSVISGLVISGVMERNETGNEKVDTALRILGGLLSGEPPPPTPTPVPRR